MEGENIGCQYSYIDYITLPVRDISEKEIEYSKGDMDVWFIENPATIDFIKTAILNINLEYTVALIFINLSEPQSIQASFEMWIKNLSEILISLVKENLNLQDRLKDKIKSFIIKTRLGKSTIPERPKEIKEEELIPEIKLDSNTLIVNLGIPIIIVASKSDLINNSDIPILNEKNINCIHKYLREEALKYGASVCFCSSKNSTAITNIDLLYSYILHRLYNFKFPYNELKDEKDKIFIPSGYDSYNIIQEFYKNSKDNISSVFSELSKKIEIRKDEIVCENFNEILKQKYSANQPNQPNSNSIQKQPLSQLLQSSPENKTEAQKGTQKDAKSFFMSLMNKDNPLGPLQRTVSQINNKNEISKTKIPGIDALANKINK